MSLFRTKLWDDRSPIVRGLHNIIPGETPVEPVPPSEPDVTQFSSVKHAWETTFGVAIEPIFLVDENSALWQDASATIPAVAEDDPVDAVTNDGSLGGNALKVPGASQPIVSLSDMGARSIEFDGDPGAGFILPDSVRNTIVSGQGYEVFVLFQTTDATTDVGLYGVWGTGGNEHALIYRRSSAPIGSPTWGVPAGFTGDTDTSLNDGNPHILGGHVNKDNEFRCSLDGVFLGDVITPALPANGTQGMVIGSYGGTGSEMTGFIRAVRVYDRALTAAQRAQVVADMLAGERNPIVPESDQDVLRWEDRIAGELLRMSAIAPRFLEGEYTRTGWPVLDFASRSADTVDLVGTLTTPCDIANGNIHVIFVGTWPEAQQGGTEVQRVIGRYAWSNGGSFNYYVADVIQDTGAGGPYQGLAGGSVPSAGGFSTTATLSKTRGGWLRATFDGVDRTLVSDNGTSWATPQALNTLDGLTLGTDASGRSVGYIHAVYIVQGDSELAEIEAFIEAKWQNPTYDGGDFPLFGQNAGDCVELDAADLSAAGDGNPIAANWVDRQGARAFTSGGAAIWHADWRSKGFPAVEVLNGNSNSIFEFALAYAQPGTMLVHAAPAIVTGSSIIVFTGNPVFSTDDMWSIAASSIISRNGIKADEGSGFFPTTGWVSGAFRSLRGSNYRCDGPRLLGGVFDGADSRVYRDGLQEASGDAGSLDMVGLSFGNYGFTETPMVIHWAGLWPIALTQEQILQVAKYRGIV